MSDYPERTDVAEALRRTKTNGLIGASATDQYHILYAAEAFAAGDLVPASEAEDAYDQGVADGQRIVAGIGPVWLCIEKHPTQGFRISNLPGGPKLCYFGGDHSVICGWHELVRAPHPDHNDIREKDCLKTDWDMVGYHLATRGIPADVEEDFTDDYEVNPWRPAPNSEVVRITVSKPDAARLAQIVASVVDAPRMWWCELRRTLTAEQPGYCAPRMDDIACGPVRVVKEMTE